MPEINLQDVIKGVENRLKRWHWQSLQASRLKNRLGKSNWQSADAAAPIVGLPLDDQMKGYLVLPKFLAGGSSFALSDELAATYEDFVGNRMASCSRPNVAYYDEAPRSQFHATMDSWLLHATESDVLALLYGVNRQFPPLRSVRKLLKAWPGSRVLILTDAVMDESLVAVDRLASHLEVVVGLDHMPVSRVDSVSRVGPLLGVFSKNKIAEYTACRASVRKSVDVGIFGTRYSDRDEYLNALVDNDIDAKWIGGRYGEERLSESEYVRAACSVKIRVVSMRKTANYSQLKGHVSESLLAGSVLLVDQTSPLSGILEEGKHFLSFRDPQELVHVVKALLADKSLQDSLAIAGNAVVKDKPDLLNPWYRVFDSSIY